MPQDMHPEDIKATLRKRGLNFSILADENDISKQTIAAAVRSRASGRAEKILADAIGMKPRDIWPSRYRRDGTRIMLRRTKTGAEAAA